MTEQRPRARFRPPLTIRPRRVLGGVAALLVGCLLPFAGLLADRSPGAQAAGNSWQNANGTSTTATGQGTTIAGQPALVFAFDTDNPVSACSSSAGSCSVAMPDGANSFEVFASSPTASLSFSVTTMVPIACTFALGFKVSFNGALPYTPQVALTPENTCGGTPPPGHGTPCPVSAVTGYFEPAQAVWQDDPTVAGRFFNDRPGKQLTRTSPTSYAAELPMVQGKPTLLFGIDHAQNAIDEAPHDRWNIVIRGVTTGDTPVSVKMKFSGHGAGVTLDHTTDVLASIDLDGTCGASHAFTVTLPAPDGIPPDDGKAFTFGGTGAYTLKDELVRVDGESTSLDVTVSGTVVATRMPILDFVPVRLAAGGGSAANASLQAQSDALRDQVVGYLPDYYPLRPGDVTAGEGSLLDLSAKVKADLGTWKTWARSIIGVDSQEVTSEIVIASLADAFGLGGILGKHGRTVVVVSPADWAMVRPSARAFAPSQKVIFVRGDQDHFTVAHELAHTMPYLWSGAQMQQQCGIDYHNTSYRIVHGFRVTLGGDDNRAPEEDKWTLMGNEDHGLWIDQCTYWNLVNQLQNPPDPLVLLVRGRLAMHGAKVIGQLFAPYRLNSALDLAPGTGGSWAIVARSASGAILARYPFSPHWQTEDGGSTSIISFAYRIPATPGVVRLDLVGPRGVLSTLVASPHAPAVAITAPRGGGRVTPVHGTVHVAWTGHDADGNTLLYTVLYSNDDGSTWQAQSVEQRATSFEVHLSPGTSHLVKIVVTDGARSGQASVAFTTP